MNVKVYTLIIGLGLVLVGNIYGAEEGMATMSTGSQAMTATTSTTAAAVASVINMDNILAVIRRNNIHLKAQSLLARLTSFQPQSDVDKAERKKNLLNQVKSICDKYPIIVLPLISSTQTPSIDTIKTDLDTLQNTYDTLEKDVNALVLQSGSAVDSSALGQSLLQPSSNNHTAVIATAAAAAPAASNGAPALSMDDARAHLRNIHSKLDSTREQLRPLLLPGSEAAKALDAWDAVAHQSASAAPLSQTGMNAVAQPAPATATAASAPQQNPLVVPAAAMPAPAKISVITPGKVILTVGTVVGGYAAWRNRDELLKRAKPLAQKMATAVQQQCVIS